MVDELGAIAKGQLVCGLHVHVGMESFEACLRTLDGIRPWLGDRAPTLGELAVPRRRGDGRALVAARHGCGSCRGAARRRSSRRWRTGRRRSRRPGSTTRRIWWDARPHPRLGTLEVRIADQATSVERSAALVALVQALCAAPPEPGSRPRRRGRARGARARHVGARRDAARATPRRCGSSRSAAETGSRRWQQIS